MEANSKQKEIEIENRNSVIGSAVLAKAVIKKQDGSVEMIVVFERSTKQEFYWIFNAKSSRTPRSKWIFKKFYPVVVQIGMEPLYKDFPSFVEHHARNQAVEVFSRRVYKKRLLNRVTGKQEHESVRFEWDHKQSLHGATFNLTQRGLFRKMKGSDSRYQRNWVYVEPKVREG